MLNNLQIKEWRNSIRETDEFALKATLVTLLSDPSSLKILYILSKDSYVCPSDFSRVLGVTLPAISHHLAKMKQMGIVTTVRHNHNICYSLAKTREGRLVKKLTKTLI